MNLGKLLAAGKSIISGRGGMSYRVNKHVYLPKFGTAQNPFQPPAEAEPAPPRAESAPAPMKKAVAPVAAKTQKIPALAEAPVRTASWASRLNPISKWRSQPAPVPAGRPAVQSELSLDSVKVVHNDLSDADVEVVPIKSRTADPAKVPVLAPPEKPWEFMAERMFHATVE